MHSSESRLVIGPSNILFAGVYVCTFQPGNFTGWGSQGVKAGLGKTSRTTLGIKNNKNKNNKQTQNTTKRWRAFLEKGVLGKTVLEQMRVILHNHMRLSCPQAPARSLSVPPMRSSCLARGCLGPFRCTLHNALFSFRQGLGFFLFFFCRGARPQISLCVASFYFFPPWVVLSFRAVRSFPDFPCTEQASLSLCCSCGV